MTPERSKVGSGRSAEGAGSPCSPVRDPRGTAWAQEHLLGKGHSDLEPGQGSAGAGTLPWSQVSSALFPWA